MWGDPEKLDNHYKGYLEFVNDSKLYPIIIIGYALNP